MLDDMKLEGCGGMGLSDIVYGVVNRVGRNSLIPFTQFIMDWNCSTMERKKEILEEDISDECPSNILPVIASVVHGLCDRDGLSLFLSEYLLEAKSEEGMTISGLPMESSFSFQVRDRSPDVCWQHNVFYEVEYLYTTCDVFTSINKDLSGVHLCYGSNGQYIVEERT